MKKFELFDHTADIGLRIYGHSLQELFENAACGLFDVLTNTAKVRPLRERHFELQRDTTEELLVEWLGSLLYACDAHRLLFSRFFVERIDAVSLTARACGEKLSPGRHEIKTVVKAVTYHRLAVTHANGLWQATVVLDV